MSPRTQKQFEELRESKKKLIREASLKIFAEEGYHSATISKIANKAKISKGLIYNYYESKEELLRDLVRDGFQKISTLIDPDSDGIITKEEIIYMIEETFQMLKENRSFWLLYFSILPQPSVLRLVKDIINETLDNYTRLFESYFRHAGYDDPKAEALILGSLMDGISFHYLYNPLHYPLEPVKNKLINMYK